MKRINSIDKKLINKLETLRTKYENGDNISQGEINSICEEFEIYKNKLHPSEKDEIFYLVDAHGKNNELKAPRWLCHLFGLRHRCVHILIQWRSPSLGKVYIFQVRSWTKSDSPGHLDISVGGHIVGDSQNIAVQTAYKEMEEELGITQSDLIGRKLLFRMEYESKKEDDLNHFYNNEWRLVYTGEIATDRYDKIKFNDNEVVGLYLCPESEAIKLLEQKLIPIANALKESLKYCICI